MVYILAPVGNALTQMGAGPSFAVIPQGDVSWDEIQRRLAELAAIAQEIGNNPLAKEVHVWLSPSYLAIPEPDQTTPRATLADLMSQNVAPDLSFMSIRLERVRGHAPNPSFDQHVCHGLNACKGQDILGTALEAGVGACATADPHVCSGQNHCKGQGGCGFTPNPTATPDLQNHPGENNFAGQVLNPQTGYYQANPNADSACGSPILPSLVNTWGENTPASAGRGNDPQVFAAAQGFVWDFARYLFEKRMKSDGIKFGPDKDIKAYRGCDGDG
jgi:hypothetical protein